MIFCQLVNNFFLNLPSKVSISWLLLDVIVLVLTLVYSFLVGLVRMSGLARYPAGYRILKLPGRLSSIVGYSALLTEVIRPDIQQFGLLYQTKFTLSGQS